MTNKDAFDNKLIRVPFFSPYISLEDKKTVLRALNATLLTDGPQLQRFENAFAQFSGAKYAVGVSNATSALHISLKALGIGKGDEVIVPDITFVATANAVLLTGATPVIADVDETDLNISVDSIKKSITTKTKAILPVHMAGNPCKIKEIQKIAKANNLAIVEDCAHAVGAKYMNKHVGNYGVAGCFSFYPTKNITTIEGGMIITNSKKIVEYAKTLRNHGITKSLTQRYSTGKPWNYDVLESGYNYRLDEIRASLGLSQLKQIKKLNRLRQKICLYYNSKLGKIQGIVTPLFSKDAAYHLYILRIQKEYGMSRDNLFNKLLKNGIRTSVHYKPLHEFTIFRKKAKIIDRLENSKRIYREIISLPLYPTLSKNDQDFVLKCIIER